MRHCKFSDSGRENNAFIFKQAIIIAFPSFQYISVKLLLANVKHCCMYFTLKACNQFRRQKSSIPGGLLFSNIVPSFINSSSTP